MTQHPTGNTPRREVFQGNPLLVFPEREDVPDALLPFYDFWIRNCGGAVPISRAALDPVRLPTAFLPWVFILNIHRDPLDFEYRLIGTGLTNMLSRDLTGQRVSEVFYPPGHAEFLLHRLRMVAEQDVVVMASFDGGWVDKSYLRIVSLLLPGSTDGEETDLVYGVTVRELADGEHA